MTTVGNFAVWRDAGHWNCKFSLLCTRMQYEYFYVMNVHPCFSFWFENTKNIPLIDGEWCTQCMLPRWFHHWYSGCVRAQKLAWKMCHMLKHILHIQHLPLKVCAVQSPSSHHAIRRIEKLPNCQLVNHRGMSAAQLIPMRNNQKQRRNSEFAKWHDTFTPVECADEWMQNNADFKWLCHEWLHHDVHDSHSVTMVWRVDSFTVSFPGDVCRESGLTELASVNRRTRLRSGRLIRKWL